MPQGLGKNLYPTLSVFENIDFFGACSDTTRRSGTGGSRGLLRDAGLTPFADRPAAKLSGGMKQKVGLCCALIHDPELLILDEPTTGVDPLSRRQFWELIDLDSRQPARHERDRLDRLHGRGRAVRFPDRDERRPRAARPARPPNSRGRPAPIRSMRPSSVCCPRHGAQQPYRCRHPAARRGPRGDRDRSRPPDAAVRRFRCRRRRQLPHQEGRDLRLSRLERLRQDHDHEDADRPPARERRHRAAVRQHHRCRATCRCGGASATCRRASRSIRSSRSRRTWICMRGCSSCRRTRSRRASTR